jgi:hypothetical protein
MARIEAGFIIANMVSSPQNARVRGPVRRP